MIRFSMRNSFVIAVVIAFVIALVRAFVIAIVTAFATQTWDTITVHVR